jgi:hypothetical protein
MIQVMDPIRLITSSFWNNSWFNYTKKRILVEKQPNKILKTDMIKMGYKKKMFANFIKKTTIILFENKLKIKWFLIK